MVEYYHNWPIDKENKNRPSWSIEKILDEAVQYALNHGEVVPEKPFNSSNGEGGDAISIGINHSIQNLKHNDLEIRVDDMHVSRSYGTYNIGWSEEDFRRVEIYLKNKLVIHASKSLGGKKGQSGMLSSTKETIEPKDWEIKKSVYLKRVKKLLEKVKAKYK